MTRWGEDWDKDKDAVRNAMGRAHRGGLLSLDIEEPKRPSLLSRLIGWLTGRKPR